MSIPYSGVFTRSAGLISALGKQVKLIDLKAVKKIDVNFDPFHSNAKSIRDLLFYLSGPKVLNTNTNCRIKTNILTDRSEPFVKINLVENGTIRLKAGNLTTLELLQLLNKHISSLAKSDETVSTPVKTKKVAKTTAIKTPKKK